MHDPCFRLHWVDKLDLAVLALVVLVALLLHCDRPAYAGPGLTLLAAEDVPYNGHDLLQIVAHKAVAGKYGKVPRWKLDWYKRVIDRGLTVQGRCKLTYFGPFDPPRMYGGPWAYPNRHRVRLGPDHAAANREVPTGSIVWTRYGLRVVVDRGGAVTLANTQPGESANLDFWWHHDLGTHHQEPYALLRRGW